MASTRFAQLLAADYDPIAWFYDRHWSNHYHPWALAVLERLLPKAAPPGFSILDVCCGNGVLARELSCCGFLVTGIDASQDMLEYAAANAPEAEFMHADARAFHFPPSFHAAISTFDSLNHMTSDEDLMRVFRNVYEALLPCGVFVFDLNLEHCYTDRWGTTCSTVDDQHACFIRGHYDPATRLGHTEISLFVRNGSWERRDVEFLQRFHPPEHVLALLADAGFGSPECLDAAQDLGVEGPFSSGRGVFVARKPRAPESRD